MLCLLHIPQMMQGSDVQKQGSEKGVQGVFSFWRSREEKQKKKTPQFKATASRSRPPQPISRPVRKQPPPLPPRPISEHEKKEQDSFSLQYAIDHLSKEDRDLLYNFVKYFIESNPEESDSVKSLWISLEAYKKQELKEKAIPQKMLEAPQLLPDPSYATKVLEQPTKVQQLDLLSDNRPGKKRNESEEVAEPPPLPPRDHGVAEQTMKTQPADLLSDIKKGAKLKPVDGQQKGQTESLSHDAMLKKALSEKFKGAHSEDDEDTSDEEDWD